MRKCTNTSSLGEVQVLENRRRRASFVQGVEVEAWRAGLQQFLGLTGRVFDAEFGHSLVVGTAPIEFLQKRPREVRTAQRDEALDLCRAQNRDETGDQRDAHTEIDQKVAELEVVLVVEEQLGDDEIGPVIDLVLQIAPVGELAVAAGDVSLGKARNAD